MRTLQKSSLQSCGIGYEIVTYTQSSNLLFDITDDHSFFDLILLDIEMPGITGIELSEKIKLIDCLVAAIADAAKLIELEAGKEYIIQAAGRMEKISLIWIT